MIHPRHDDRKEKDGAPKNSAKKPYTTPLLKEYGQIEKFTQGTGGFKGDGGAGHSRIQQ